MEEAAAAAAREALVPSSSTTSMAAAAAAVAAAATEPLLSSCSSASMEEEDRGDSCDTWSAKLWKGDPTDDDLVLHYLRRHLRGFVPYGTVLKGSPYSEAPWKLLLRNRRIQEGFFFAERKERRSKGHKPIVQRTVGDVGVWKNKYCIQGVSHTYFGCRVEWRKAKLAYYVRRNQALESAGWSMWEYEITNPECYRRPSDEDDGVCSVLCRVMNRKWARAEAHLPKAGELLWHAVEVKQILDIPTTAASDGRDDGSDAGDAESKSCDAP